MQVTWAPHLQLYGAFPNLVLAGGRLHHVDRAAPRAGLVWACVGGLLLDLTAPGPLGPHALALLSARTSPGFWVRNVDRAELLQPALAAAASTALYSLVLVGADDTTRPAGAAAGARGPAGRSRRALYNAVLVAASVAALAARRIQERRAAT